MKVDVILPTYKGEQWVGEAIESVLAQTYTNWHLTVVDDASPDNTFQKVEQFYFAYPERITLIRLKKNQRAVTARMIAIEQTDGEVITFLDQDDLWLPQKLEKQIQRLQMEPKVYAVHTDVIHITPVGSRLIASTQKENSLRSSVDYRNLSCQELCKVLFLNNPIRLVSTAVLRESFEAIGGFNQTLFGGEEWEFWVRFSSQWRIGYLAEPLIEHRIHTLNTSTYFQETRTTGLLTALELMEKTYPYLKPLAPKRRAFLLRRSIATKIERRAFAEARQDGWKLVQLAPLDIRGLWLVGFAYAGSYGYPILSTYRRIKSSLLRNLLG